MYTIVDEGLWEQLRHPITRTQLQPQPKRAYDPDANPLDTDEPFEPWKVPFPDEREWQLFLELMLDALRDATEEARAIFNKALRGVVNRINSR